MAAAPFPSPATTQSLQLALRAQHLALRASAVAQSDRRKRGAPFRPCCICRTSKLAASPPLAWPLVLMLNIVRSELGEQQRMGTHAILEVQQASFSTLNSTRRVRDALLSAAKAGDLTVVGDLFHAFPVQGVSGVVLVSESHLSIHTWPEYGYAAIDIFTCGHVGPAPCTSTSRALYSLARDGWHCADNQLLEEPHIFGIQSKATGDVCQGVQHEFAGLWSAIACVISELHAGEAILTWIDRGIHSPSMPELQARPSSTSSQGAWQQPEHRRYGWLGSLEGPDQRVEL